MPKVFHRKVSFIFCLSVLTACESEATKQQNELVEQLRIENARLKDSVAKAPPPLAVNPCSKPRPYKNWSNEELNIAQVEYMGTPQSMELIREAGCRTR